MGDINFTDRSYIDEIFREMEIYQVSHTQSPVADSGYVSFTNGVFHLKSKAFCRFTPKIFLVADVSFFYITDKGETPVLNSLVNDFCCGYENRKNFIMCLIYAIIKQPTNLFSDLFTVQVLLVKVC